MITASIMKGLIKLNFVIKVKNSFRKMTQKAKYTKYLCGPFEEESQNNVRKTR